MQLQNNTIHKKNIYYICTFTLLFRSCKRFSLFILKVDFTILLQQILNIFVHDFLFNKKCLHVSKCFHHYNHQI